MKGRHIALATTLLLSLTTGGLRSEDQEQPDRYIPSVGEARATWEKLITVSIERQPMADAARRSIERLLDTESGRWLIGELADTYIDPVVLSTRPRIVVGFVGLLPPGAYEDNGYYRPVDPGADEYEVLVKLVPVVDELTRSIVLFGVYPDNSACDIIFWYQEPASSMAHTLFHELLHVWYIHEYRFEKRKYPTGHGNARWCQFEEDFLDLLRAHAHELDELEGTGPPPLYPNATPEQDDTE
jgi:hypothetical protein